MENSVLPGKPFDRWQDYMDYLRPLLFAVVNKDLLATECDEDGIDSNGNIDGKML